MLPQEIVIKKREKKELIKEEIDFFVKGIVNGKVDDDQVASFTMAVLLNKLSKSERVNLTMAMANSGKTLKYPKSITPIIDKHSTGGVGDKVSLMLAPIVACLGVYDPMVAGRGLGHTGGTIDKLESIPGYNCYPTQTEFKKVIKKVGCGIMGATKDIAPADKKMYSIRDISGTVESMDLITSSILSKKLAAGLDGLVMDVKYGNGAFMDTKRKAKKLAKYIEQVGTGAGMPTKAILTDMNSVLGKTVGNALEVYEAIDFLNGKYDKKLYKVTEDLAIEMVLLARKNNISRHSERSEESHCATGYTSESHKHEKILRYTQDDGVFHKSRSQIRKQIHKVIHNGEALKKFGEMITAMGGPKDFLQKYDKYLELAPFVKVIYPETVGKVKYIDTRAVGMAIVELGGGRTSPEQKIDHSVGFSEFCQIGDKVGKGYKPLAKIYAKTDSEIKRIEKIIQKSIKL